MMPLYIRIPFMLLGLLMMLASLLKWYRFLGAFTNHVVRTDFGVKLVRVKVFILGVVLFVCAIMAEW